MQYETVRWTASKDGERKEGTFEHAIPESLDEAIELYGSEQALLTLAQRMARTDERNRLAAQAFPRVRTEADRERDRLARQIVRASQQGEDISELLERLQEV